MEVITMSTDHKQSQLAEVFSESNTFSILLLYANSYSYLYHLQSRLLRSFNTSNN